MFPHARGEDGRSGTFGGRRFVRLRIKGNILEPSAKEFADTVALSADALPRPFPVDVPRDRPRGLTLTVLEFSLSTASLDELEAITKEVGPDRLNALWNAHPELKELALVRTCHRVECVALHNESIASFRSSLPGRADAWKEWTGPEAVHHIFRVSAGLESLAWGEREVREQVRAAGNRIRTRHPRSVLADLFRSAIDATDRFGGPAASRRSIASIAATTLLEEIPRPFPRILVVGSGTVGSQVVEALGPYARTTILYRHKPPSDDFLRANGARAASIESLAAELPLCDGLVAAAKAGERILRPIDLAGRGRGIVLVDLGVPRNIDPRVAELRGTRLVDLAELHLRHRPPGDSAVLDRVVLTRALERSAQLAKDLASPDVDALMRSIDAIRRQELERARPYFGRLTSSQRDAIEHFSQRLVRQLMRTPLDELRRLPPGPERERLLAMAVQILGSTPGP